MSLKLSTSILDIHNLAFFEVYRDLTVNSLAIRSTPTKESVNISFQMS